MDVKALITESLDDAYLSREEKQDITNSLKRLDLSPNDRLQLIKYAINEASSKMDAANSGPIMKWLKKMTLLIETAGSYLHDNNAYFSHFDDIRKKVIGAIEEAHSALDIAVFTISENNIANSISDAHKRGIKVRIITDDDKINDVGSDIFKLKSRGLNIKIDENNSLMHHKFMVIDGTRVLNGSYNWTRTASEVNNENIVITNNPTIVKSFSQEFDRLWDQMKDL